MVGFSSNSVIKKDQQNAKGQLIFDFDPSLPESEEISLSFVDSLLDFDDWIEENIDTLLVGHSMDDLGKVDVFENFLQVGNDEGAEKSLENGDLGNELGKFDVSGNSLQVVNDRFDLGKVKAKIGNDGLDLKRVENVEESLEVGENGFDIGKAEVEKSSEVGGDEICVGSEIGDGGEKKFVDLGSLIAKEIGKVSLGGEVVASIECGDCHASNVVVSTVDAENGLKSDDEESDGDSESESASSSSSPSSSSSSSDDDDGEEEEMKKEEMDMEEGEIRDFEVEEMAAWSDDEDEIGGSIAAGPIRSKNEVQDLPPVPPVNVTIQPHHQTLPVGVVLSMIGSQVIVEGVEKHNPLSEGSILWITESRSPLGIIDEIFGPVKNPYYIVRYNSESEVPSGIQQGSLISFVPEFADYVLNNNNLYKKGYDASNEHDEELLDEVEFSDDEKEAEYKRMQKMSKRGTSDQKSGNMRNDEKKFKNRSGNWNNNNQYPSLTSLAPQDTIQQSPSQTNSSRPQGHVQGFPGGPGPSSTPTSQQAPQPVNFNSPSGVWTNGTPFVHPQGTGMSFPNGLPTNMLWMQQQNYLPQPFQMPMPMPMPNGVPFPQQFNPGQMMPPNFVSQGQPNFFQGQAFSPWPVNMGQNMFNIPQFAPGFQSPITQPQLVNVQQQGFLPNGPQVENSNGMRPPFTTSVGGGNSGNSSQDGNSNHGGGPPFCGNVQQQGVLYNGTQVENSNNMRPPFTSVGGGDSGNLSQVGNSNHGGGPPFGRNVQQQQGVLPNGSQVENSSGMRPPFTGGGGNNSGNFRGGNSNRGGRQLFRGRGGGGRFRGGRGGRQQRGGRS